VQNTVLPHTLGVAIGSTNTQNWKPAYKLSVASECRNWSLKGQSKIQKKESNVKHSNNICKTIPENTEQKIKQLSTTLAH
jgi:hypothetical protein